MVIPLFVCFRYDAKNNAALFKAIYVEPHKPSGNHREAFLLGCSEKNMDTLVVDPKSLKQTVVEFAIDLHMIYFCATNSRARLNSGLVEFDPSQIFNSSA